MWQTALKTARKNARRGRRGMSLVEIMVVIAIVLTMMSILAWGVMSTYQDSLQDTTTITMTKLGNSIELYALRKKKLPDSAAFEALTEGAVDGWNRPFELRVPGEDAPYSIVSLGRDGQEGGQRWDEDLVWSPSQSSAR